MIAASSRSGGSSIGAAGPGGAERAGKILGSDIARAREGKDAPSLPGADLGDDMSRRAEPVDADPLAGARGHQRTPADQSGTEERSQGDGIIVLRQAEGVGRVGDRMGSEAAVAGVAREQRLVAQVLMSRDAVGAMSAGMAEPGNAHALPQLAIADSGSERLHPSRRSHGRE